MRRDLEAREAAFLAGTRAGGKPGMERAFEGGREGPSLNSREHQCQQPPMDLPIVRLLWPHAFSGMTTHAPSTCLCLAIFRKPLTAASSTTRLDQTQRLWRSHPACTADRSIGQRWHHPPTEKHSHPPIVHMCHPRLATRASQPFGQRQRRLYALYHSC